MPHDIVVTRDGSVFVGDVGSKAIYKFTTESKSTIIYHSILSLNGNGQNTI